MLSKLRAVLAAAVLLAATPALSVPITYGLDTVGGGSNIQIQAFNTQTSALVFDETLNLKNTSFMVFDPTGSAVFMTRSLANRSGISMGRVSPRMPPQS